MDISNGNDLSYLRRRIKAAALILSLILLVLIIRLGYLQIIMGAEFQQRSENNSIRLRKIPAARGMILDGGGNILVENRPLFNLIFVPNRQATAQKVVADLKILYKERNLSFSKDIPRPPESNFFPVKIESAITREKLAVIETNSNLLPGLNIEIIPARQYLYGEMMAHVIGYVGEISKHELARDITGRYSQGDLVGISGLEETLNGSIQGKNGAEQVEINVFGKEVKVLGRLESQGGVNAVLNIDLAVQKAAWQALGGRTGAAVVLDPRDGAVLALVSSPSFDPNLFQEGISRKDWQRLVSNSLKPLENRVASGQYPPASAYKLVVAAAALEAGLIGPETSFHCNGEYKMGNRNFRCWRKEGHGKMNLHRAIAQSCDVYFYQIGRLLGVDAIALYAGRFGFGRRTGIDLPQEKRGHIPTKKWKLERYREPWQGGDTLSAAIGQGFNTATPLQLAVAYSALANGGHIYRPRLVRELKHQDGSLLKEFPPEKAGELGLSEKNLDILRKALWAVVNEPGGTGAALKRPEMDVSGKTGTAQVVAIPQGEKGRRFKATSRNAKDHSIFVCYAPESAPEITVAVVLEHAGIGGGAGAAPVARRIVDAYFAGRKPGANQAKPVLSNLRP